jgi:hypothetical protein
MELAETYHTVRVRTTWHIQAIIVINFSRYEGKMVSKQHFAFGLSAGVSLQQSVQICGIVLLCHDRHLVLYMR